MRAFPDVLAQALPAPLCAEGLDAVPPEVALRLAHALHAAPDPGAALAALRLPKRTERAVRELIAHFGAPRPETPAQARRLLREIGPERAAELARLRAWPPGVLEEALARGDAYSIPQLAITGADLAAAGIPAGPGVGRLLRALLDGVVEGENRKRARVAPLRRTALESTRGGILQMNQGVEILRALAARAAECAADPVNAERAKLYRAVNDRTWSAPWSCSRRSPGTNSQEEALRARCTDPDFAALETYLRREIYLWEHAQADRIFRPYLPVPKAVEITSVGLNVREEERGKESGGIYSHRYENQLKDDGDLAKLRDPEVRYDHAETMRRFSKAAEAVGDILPVKLMGLETGYGPGA